MRALIAEDGGQRGALAAVRALGRAGWTVGVAAPVEGMAARSRYARWHEVPNVADDPDAFIDALADVAAGYDVVLAAGDRELLAVTAGRDRIPAAVAHPSHAVVLRAVDKLRLVQAAERAGMAAPRTFTDVPDPWPGPVIVKERVHGDARSHGRVPHVQAVIAATPAQAQAALDAIDATGSAGVVQERISGPLMAVTALVDDECRPLALMAQRAGGVWPSGAGPSVRAEVIDLDPLLGTSVERLLSEVGWTGLVQLQFLVGEDGVPRLIDLNGRIYGSIALTEAAGLPIVAAWAAQATGRPLPPLPEPRIGTRYQWLEGDLRRALSERRGGLAHDVVSTLTFARGAESAVFAGDDLRPQVYVGTMLARRWLRKATGRWT